MSGQPRSVPAGVAEALSSQREIVRQLRAGVEQFAGIDRDDLDTGVSPKTVVHRDGKVALYRFDPRIGEDERHPVPVLIVYAVFNRWWMMDIAEDRSLIRGLLDQGLDVYLLDWGHPDRGDRYLQLSDYIDGYVRDAVDVLRDRHGDEPVNMIGVCQGGVTSLCYAALYPHDVRNLITMVTPVDFAQGTEIVAQWGRSADPDVAVDALGMIPGELVSLGFLMRSPFERNLVKYLGMLDVLDDRERLLSFLRMEKWIFDTPDVPGETYRQWMTDCYRGNKLIAGEMHIGGRRVDLHNVTMPVLNIYAERDDLIPPASSRPLGDHVGTDDYTARSFDVGHIGMYVSGRVQRDLPTAVANWLRDR
ncbi:MAG: class III poly(R)-hydroxyalkanoic acid synthase subunit PhaC [Actinobacteria bacterium]|nr:class III poly(R)-hydroxyalkanoic acid synthase subunit PhaC [Actinomycetota bacterium]